MGPRMVSAVSTPVVSPPPPLLHSLLYSDFAMIEHDPSRAQPNLKLPLYSEGPEHLEWRPM